MRLKEFNKIVLCCIIVFFTPIIKIVYNRSSYNIVLFSNIRVYNFVLNIVIPYAHHKNCLELSSIKLSKYFNS